MWRAGSPGLLGSKMMAVLFPFLARCLSMQFLTMLTLAPLNHCTSASAMSYSRTLSQRWYQVKFSSAIFSPEFAGFTHRLFIHFEIVLEIKDFIVTHSRA